MSVKHVKEYYQQICKDYTDMVDTIKELEDLVADQVISPEKFEELKAPIETVKTNWQRWSYVMFLLDQPNKKEKVKRYQQQNKKIIENLIPKSEREENKEAIQQFKDNIANTRKDD